MTRIALALGCLFSLMSASAEHAAVLPGISAKEFGVAERVVLAGTPDMAKLTQLPTQSTVIVDLRTAAENIAGQAQSLKDHGFEYHNIPISSAVIDPNQLAALAAIAEANTDKLLIVNCRSANRAGMLWGAYLLEQGATLEHALELVGPAITGKANRAALLNFHAGREAARQQ